jgi:hypothetical protein
MSTAEWWAMLALGIVIDMLSRRHPHLVHPGNSTVH